jgi:hypothetical protein
MEYHGDEDEITECPYCGEYGCPIDCGREE